MIGMLNTSASLYRIAPCLNYSIVLVWLSKDEVKQKSFSFKRKKKSTNALFIKHGADRKRSLCSMQNGLATATDKKTVVNP